jgi:hypothetical protein
LRAKAARNSGSRAAVNPAASAEDSRATTTTPKRAEGNAYRIR